MRIARLESSVRALVIASVLPLLAVSCSSEGLTFPPTPPPAGAAAGQVAGAASGGTVSLPFAGTGTTPMMGPPVGTAGIAAVAGSGGARAGTEAVGAGASGSPLAGAGAGAGATGGGTYPLNLTGPKTVAGFMNLAPPMGMPLPEAGKMLTPPPPAGWVYHEIAGSICRDGSPAGFFVHKGTVPRLMIFLEGGGACMNDHLCAFNQKNVNESFAGDGLTLLNSTLGTVQDRQQPGVFSQQDHKGQPAGLFDLENPMNPMKGWSEIYVPYCSGDVHFGTKKNGSVQGLSNQQFLGYENMKLFISRIVPSFPGLEHVVLAGSSAGSIAAMLNVSMVQDAFGSVQVDVIADSGLPLRDKYWPVCLQKRYRESWGLDGALPPDCEGCKQADGGGLVTGLAEYYHKKHPDTHFAAISRTEDEIMRLFFSGGLNDCANYDTLDPVAIVISNVLDPSVLYPGPQYTEALLDFRDYAKSVGLPAASFLVGPPNQNYHQIIFRPDFYTLKVGGKTAADFIRDFLNGVLDEIQP